MEPLWVVVNWICLILDSRSHFRFHVDTDFRCAERVWTLATSLLIRIGQWSFRKVQRRRVIAHMNVSRLTVSYMCSLSFIEQMTRVDFRLLFRVDAVHVVDELSPLRCCEGVEINVVEYLLYDLHAWAGLLR